MALSFLHDEHRSGGEGSMDIETLKGVVGVVGLLFLYGGIVGLASLAIDALVKKVVRKEFDRGLGKPEGR